MNRKLGINVDCLIGISDIDTLDLIKAAGFETFFSNAYKNDEVSALKKKADELGLTYEFIHASYHHINEIWTPGDGYKIIFESMKEAIDSAANNDIGIVITHVSSGWNPPPVNDFGLSRFDELVNYAKERGVILAFENLRLLGNLACLMDRYEKAENVFYCFDCGHEHCYTKTICMMDVFTTRVCCTHIHDNHSRPFDDKVNDHDEHLLPFDGTYNYEKMMRKLDEYNYTGSLMLEVNQRIGDYKKMTHKEFLATCYARIQKISQM